MRFENVTFYRKAEFFGHFVRCQARWASIEVKPYAQYPRALYVTYLEKGKRKPRAFVVRGTEPHFLMLAGHSAFEAPPMMGPETQEGPMACSTSRHLSCAEEWDTEFEAAVEAFLAAHPEAKVLCRLSGVEPAAHEAVA